MKRTYSTLALTAGLLAVLLTGCIATQPTSEHEAAEEETVNVAYGEQPRRNVTGSISSLDEDDINNQPVQRVEELLQGRVAGARVIYLPNGQVSVQIRGRNSIMGSTEPLYVIDGIPVSPSPGGGIPGVNPRDIASIDVLKDASSTAIYGSRGANGVVLITTKRAR